MRPKADDVINAVGTFFNDSRIINRDPTQWNQIINAARLALQVELWGLGIHNVDWGTEAATPNLPTEFDPDLWLLSFAPGEIRAVPKGQSRKLLGDAALRLAPGQFYGLAPNSIGRKP